MLTDRSSIFKLTASPTPGTVEQAVLAATNSQNGRAAECPPVPASSERTRAIQGPSLVTCRRKLPFPHHTAVEDEDATSGFIGIRLVIMPPLRLLAGRDCISS